MERKNRFRPDAFLLLSYGSPENMAQVGPFLDRILAGKTVPAARREAAEEKYRAFGGKSPLNGEIRRFLTRLRVFLAENSDETNPPPFVYAGNLYAAPFLDDVLAEIAADDRQRIRVLIAHPFGTPTGCLRYRQALAEAVERFERRFSSAEKPAMKWRFSFVEPFFDSPDYHRAVADTFLDASAPILLEQGLADHSDENHSDENHSGENHSGENHSGENHSGEKNVFVLFSAHALLADESAQSGYEAQLLSVCNVVAAMTGLGKRWSPDLSRFRLSSSVEQPENPLFSAGKQGTEPNRQSVGGVKSEPCAAQKSAPSASWRWNLVYQSRSGRADQPWSEPLIDDFLLQIRVYSPNIREVLVVPIGFFFENMETVGDLDNGFAKICAENQVRYRRAEAVGNTPAAIRLAAKLLSNGPSSAFCADSQGEFGRMDACSTCELRCKSEK